MFHAVKIINLINLVCIDSTQQTKIYYADNVNKTKWPTLYLGMLQY